MCVISEDFHIIQCVDHLQLLGKMSHRGGLSVGYVFINHTLVLCAMQDGTSTNSVAVRTLNMLNCNIFDVTCFYYTLDHVGDHFQVTILLEFKNE